MAGAASEHAEPVTAVTADDTATVEPTACYAGNAADSSDSVR